MLVQGQPPKSVAAAALPQVLEQPHSFARWRTAKSVRTGLGPRSRDETDTIHLPRPAKPLRRLLPRRLSCRSLRTHDLGKLLRRPAVASYRCRAARLRADAPHRQQAYDPPD